MPLGNLNVWRSAMAAAAYITALLWQWRVKQLYAGLAPKPSLLSVAAPLALPLRRTSLYRNMRMPLTFGWRRRSGALLVVAKYTCR